jgi:LytS/YehU family sensor histidine kinase
MQLFILKHFRNEWIWAIIDSAISNGLLFCATFFIVIREKYFYYSSHPFRKNTFFRFLRIIITPLFFSIIQYLVLQKYFNQNTDYTEFIEQSASIRFVFNLITLIAYSALCWLWMYFIDQQEIIERNTDAEALLKEAELAKLRQQLQPHFLFNSLNSISALAGSKPNEARKMIQQLSDFLRSTLRNDEQQVVEIILELQNLNLYLEIEKVRFGNRLHTEISCTDECNSKKIPSLLLQPLVENAIKFGLYDTIDDVTISISINCEPHYLVVEISNPFDSATSKASKGEGFGLSSVHRRLYLLYARTDLLNVAATENLFTAILKIPQ